jgi:hypothetical protein
MSELAPDTDTSCPGETPGAALRTLHGSRALGTFRNVSLSMFEADDDERVSMRGVSG